MYLLVEICLEYHEAVYVECAFCTVSRVCWQRAGRIYCPLLHSKVLRKKGRRLAATVLRLLGIHRDTFCLNIDLNLTRTVFVRCHLMGPSWPIATLKWFDGFIQHFGILTPLASTEHYPETVRKCLSQFLLFWAGRYEGIEVRLCGPNSAIGMSRLIEAQMIKASDCSLGWSSYDAIGLF